MPGFTISSRSKGSDENGAPHLELFYLEGDPLSMIQKTAVKSIDGYSADMYDLSGGEPKVKTQNVSTAPTTIAKDKEYEIQRWEGVVHADHITRALDKW